MTTDAQRFWDEQAPRFDEEPDHGLRDPEVRACWRDLLLSALPPAPARVADLGCGTGTIAVLLAGEGYEVHGVDLSGAMVAAATAKAAEAGVTVGLRQGDAAFPPWEPASFDVVFARHVLWTLPDPSAVVARWTRLLRPAGRLVLVEGHWYTGAGLTAAHCRELVAAHRGAVAVHPLADPRLWGRPVTDERYLLVSPPGTDPTTVAARFNGCINRRDLAGLAELMSDDHRFVDSEGNAVSGKPACLDAWRGFFDSFPDYRNVFTALTARDDVVTVVGYSECAEPALAGPALWTATVRGETVAEWRVHADTPETRARLGIS